MFTCILIYVLYFTLSSTYSAFSSVAHYFYLPSCWLRKKISRQHKILKRYKNTRSVLWINP